MQKCTNCTEYLPRVVCTCLLITPRLQIFDSYVLASLKDSQRWVSDNIEREKKQHLCTMSISSLRTITFYTSPSVGFPFPAAVPPHYGACHQPGLLTLSDVREIHSKSTQRRQAICITASGDPTVWLLRGVHAAGRVKSTVDQTCSTLDRRRPARAAPPAANRTGEQGLCVSSASIWSTGLLSCAS